MIWFFLFWIGSGLAGFAFFYYMMRKIYPEQLTDWDDPIVPFQLILSILGGPINWFAICFILDRAIEDRKEDK